MTSCPICEAAESKLYHRYQGFDLMKCSGSAVACEYANHRYGLALHNEIWHESIFEQGETFDAIVFWHVHEIFGIVGHRHE